MMSSKIRCPSYTLVFDEKWRYSGNRELNGNEVFASLKSSVQSTRGFFCRPMDGFVKSGMLDATTGQMTAAFKTFLRQSNAAIDENSSIYTVCQALYNIGGGSQNGEIDPDVFFGALRAKKMVQNPVTGAMGAPFMPADDGEMAFGDDAVVMGAQPANVGATSNDEKNVTFNGNSINDWYMAGMSLPIVFAFVNWGVCYSGHGLAMSSGKAVFDLHRYSFANHLFAALECRLMIVFSLPQLR